MQTRRPPIVLSEALYLPLGIGYDDYPSLLRQYSQPVAPSGGTPDLGVSLAGLQEADVFNASDFEFTDRPCCLIQGITSPSNGTYLRKFLQSRGVLDPNILAIDIANIAAVLATMNMQLPDVQFSVSDAAHVSSFGDGSVQVLVQDHLLNCTPHETHEDIIREAARLLDPRGFLILSFSVNPTAPGKCVWTRTEFEELLGLPLNDGAYCLRDLIDDPAIRKRFGGVLLGAMVTLDSGRLIAITPPKGNFEFYFTKAELEERLARQGLRFTYMTSESGVDSNGLSCLRYRTIVRHVSR